MPLIGGGATQSKRQHDVLRNRQMRQKMEGLEYESHLLAPQHGAGVIIERGEFGAI